MPCPLTRTECAPPAKTRILTTPPPAGGKPPGPPPRDCTGTTDTASCVDSNDTFNTFACKAKPTDAPADAPAFICTNAKD
mmetsp:Transcript_11063/g.1717  ORF Transcript_11063/g.1717 Transcript_11063/m.1717 type:complete len:80 (-) Transcript_11063:275-514(-)